MIQRSLLPFLAAPVLAPLAVADPGYPDVAEAKFDAVLDLDEGIPDFWATVLGELADRGAVAEPIIAPSADEMVDAWYATADEAWGDEVRVEDPRGFYTVTFDPVANPAVEIAWLSAQTGVESVTAAQGVAVAGDVAPSFPAPNLGQDYYYVAPHLLTLPDGTGAVGGHQLDEVLAFGQRGSTVRVANIEFDYQDSALHEDLSASNIALLQPRPGETYFATQSQRDHGTATMGVIFADQDDPANPNLGPGISGGAPNAQGYFVPMFSLESGSHIEQAIQTALLVLSPGDVILIELQTVATNGALWPISEFAPSVHAWIQIAVGLGIHVIQPAGNGGNAIDTISSIASLGDDGSIMVGAVDAATGLASTWPASGLSTNTGNRIDVCSWGNAVSTLGYGDVVPFGQNPAAWELYTANYSGTSSASAVMAGFVAAMVDVRRTLSLGLSGPIELTPFQMREALKIFEPVGYGGDQRIGQFPRARDVVRRVSSVRYGFGDDTTCQAGPTNCLPPILSNQYTCAPILTAPDVRFGEAHAGAGLGGAPPYQASITGVPMFAGYFSTLYVSLGQLGPFPLPGVPGMIFIDPTLLVPAYVDDTSPDCGGACGVPAWCGLSVFDIAIPSGPGIIGLRVYGQGVTLGPDATGPGGLYTGISNPMGITIVP